MHRSVLRLAWRYLSTARSTPSIIECTVALDEPHRRPYRLRQRAERQDDTRRRIVQATVDLHRTIGPARTTISAVADLAGVQRHTVYRHFPDEGTLFKACAAHFLTSHPPPDPKAWAEIEDLQVRLRSGLLELYSYYSANEEMIASVLRDSAVMPVGGGFRALHAAAFEALAAVRPGGRPGTAFTTVLRFATDFRAWQALGPADLSPVAAAGLMSRLLDCA